MEKTMRILPALLALLAVPACSSESFDPPPEGAAQIAVLGSDLRYYSIARGKSPEGYVTATVLTQFPRPARNEKGYMGYEIECGEGGFYRVRVTGSGSLADVAARRDATDFRITRQGDITHEIAAWHC